ncbi:MAG: succinylglutamate desuccinylase/aspartoacylase family protein, partial [Planctomycetota bacterium]
MTSRPTEPLQAPGRMDSQEAAFDGLERVIGIEDEGRPGPLVLLVAGLHGNEPGGVAALLQLFDELDGVETAGRVVGLAGNLGALRARKRHLGVDLNRMWTADNIRALGVRPPKDDLPDEAELRALFLTVEAERTAAAAIG